MITVRGLKYESDRRGVAMAIVGAIGTGGVCDEETKARLGKNCAGMAGSNDCRWCAIENHIRFED